MNPTKINWTTAGLFSLSANDNILINNNISMCVDISLLNKRRISMAEKKDNVTSVGCVQRVVQQFHASQKKHD